MAELIHPVEAAIQLSTALSDAHRQAFVKALHSNGLPDISWEELYSRQPEVTSVIDDMGNQDIFNFGDILYDSAERYSVRLLGHTAVSLTWSGVPWETLEHVGILMGAEISSLDYITNVIDLKTKLIDVQLHGRIASLEPARIYLADDLPPTALYMDDLKRVDQVLRDANKQLPEDSLSMIDAIDTIFGDGATEVLTPQTCLEMAAAVRAASGTAIIKDTSLENATE